MFLCPLPAGAEVWVGLGSWDLADGVGDDTLVFLKLPCRVPLFGGSLELGGCVYSKWLPSSPAQT